MELTLTELKNLNYFQQVVTVDMEDRRQLFDLGLWNDTVNNSYKFEPTIETIKSSAFILSKYYGRITKYALWPCTVTGFRIVFGN